MPIERRDATTQLRAVLIAGVSLLLAAVLGFAAIRSFSERGASVVRGDADRRFSVEVATLAPKIAEGGPVLFPDVGGGGQRRPIFVFHDGTDDESGWSAYVAIPPGAPSDCFVTWDRDASQLVAPCTGRTYPPDGDGLRQLTTEVNKAGQLLIDLSTPKG